MRVVLVADESAGLQVLKKLLETEHEVVAVLSSDSGRGAGIARFAASAGIPLMQPGLVTDDGFAAWIVGHDVDLLLNVHSLHIVRASVVSAPRIGSFNLHPGPLPSYAGLNAPSWAIYNGETEHGVTLHWMDPGIDSGSIAYATVVPITPEDTGLALAVRCIKAGVPLVERLLQQASTDPAGIPSRPQTGERRYFGRELPNSGRLSWERTATEIVDHVRAADYTPFPSPWGHPRTDLGGREIGIVKAARSGERTDAAPGTVGAPADAAARVACADEWVLVRLVEENGTTSQAREILPVGAHLT